MSSDAPSGHPCLRVFAIPELAHLICTLVPKSTNASLLRTCRSLFHELLHHVWENTDAVMAIVSMIPGCGIVELGDELLLPCWVMRFPSQLDLSRLSIYAPYVKNLEIPINRFPVDEYENWDDFLVCIRSTPLLPNLEHVRVSVSASAEESRITADSAKWISAFLSPSLLSFSLVRVNSWGRSLDGRVYMFMDLKLSHDFLDEISRRCPRIESLEVFPADFDLYKQHGMGGYIREGITNLHYSSPCPNTCTAISRLQCLRALSTTSFFLDNDMLLSLAQLPLLESLSICSPCDNQRVYAADIQVPDLSFPSLRHLKICEISWQTIRNLIHQKSLWQGLCTIHIQGFELSTWPDSEDDPHIWSSIIPSFADHGSVLTSLNMSGAFRQIVTPRLVDSLKRLPLTTLSLTSLDNQRSDWINIVHGLPLVEDLTIGFYINGALPVDLCSIFACMPRLSRLSLPTHSECPSQIPAIVAPPQSSSLAKVYLETNFHLAEDPREDAEAVARFLHALRPNTTYGPGGYTPAFFQGVHWENPMNTEIINDTLSKLREGQWVE